MNVREQLNELHDDAEFALASRAFALMTLTEQRIVVARLGELHYASIGARFIEAVHYAIYGTPQMEQK